MKPIFLICLALILLAMSTSACNPESDTMNKTSILDNPVCSPPCWHNIIPGRTSRDELFAALASIDNLDQSSIVQQDYPNNKDFNYFIHGNLYLDADSSTLVSAYTLDEIVIELDFFGNLNLTLEEAIEGFGEPEGVLIYHSSHGYMVINFLIPSKGIVFSFNDIGEIWKPTSIIPKLEIRSINYFSPNYYEKILEMGWFSEGKWDYQESVERIKPWKGYGNIEELYR